MLYSDSEYFRRSPIAKLRAGESMRDYLSSRIAHEKERLQQRKTKALAGQVSTTNSPAERIQIWEQMHGLTLPVSHPHRLLWIIASATHLRLEQVREVQRLRRLETSDIANQAIPSSRINSRVPQ